MRRLLLTLLFFTVLLRVTMPQSPAAFSLKQAQDYALQNSPLVKNAKIDIEIAKKKIWETTAIGLPQVNSKLSYSYMITMSSILEELNSFSSIGSNFGEIYGMLGSLGANTGDMYVLQKLDSIQKASAGSSSETAATLDDMRWGLTYDITATQLIFSGAYLVGLQTTKVYKELSEIGVSKSENDLIEQIVNTYFLVLIAEENKNILDSSYNNTSKILDYITSMNKEGFNEETDVDQMQISLSTLKNSLDMVTRQIEVARNLLKFQMGIALENNITLTDNLNSLINGSDFVSLGLAEFKVENNTDYQLMLTQEKLAALNVKYQKSAFLPDMAAFYQHQENFNDKTISFTPPNMIGVAVNIPLFGSGMKLSKISQAKLSLEKTKNMKQYVASGLQTSYSDAKASFLTAYNKHLLLKQNVVLADKIYNRSVVKYKEGIIGSLELTLAQNQFLQAQSAYYSSIIELTSAKSKLEKLIK